MPSIPSTRYVVVRDGAHLAVQQFGEGPDLIVMPGGFSHVEMRWEEPRLARSWRRIGSFARVTTFDPRGGGLSDRSGPTPSLQTRIDDLVDVLGACEVERSVFHASTEAGLVALAFAASCSERVTHLVLESTAAKAVATPDYPEGIPGDVWDRVVSLVESASLEQLCDVIAPNRSAEPAFREWFGRWVRHGSGPGGLRQLLRWIESVDLRDKLPEIRCPITVIHSTTDPLIPMSAARYITDHAPNGRLVVVENDTWWYSETADANLDVLEAIVTGRTRPYADRMRCALVIWDLVRSTSTAAALGDARWRTLLDEHDKRLSYEVMTAGGTVIKTTGDGALAVFSDATTALAASQRVCRSISALGLACRVGIHVGEVERRGEDVAGLAVHVAARICALADAEQVLLSEAAAREVTSGVRPVSSSTLRGVPGTWNLFEPSQPDA